MKNEDFRALVNGIKSTGDEQPPPQQTGTKSTSGFLRPKLFAPATPRYSKGSASAASSFAKQRAERDAAKKPKKNSKPFVPPPNAGRCDVIDEDENDERAQKVKELTERLKRGEMDMKTYERLRDEITGGSLSATHLVLGLDRQLLERVRRGEDVYQTEPTDGPHKEQAIDEDAAFDLLAEKEIVPEVHEKKEKQGEGFLRRKDILAQLKARRQEEQAAKDAQRSGFKRLGQKRQDGSYVRYEVDDQGRDVMVITYPDGTVKRKVKKGTKSEPPLLGRPASDLEASYEPNHGNGVQQKPATHSHPEDHTLERYPQSSPEEHSGLSEEQIRRKEVEDDDEDIFAGVEDYSKLVELDEQSDEEAERVTTHDTKSEQHKSTSKPAEAARLFEDEIAKHSILNKMKNPFNDPEAFKRITARAREIDISKFRDSDEPERSEPELKSKARDGESEEARLKRKLAQLEGYDRDEEDMDMGFGGSRFDDADDMEMDGKKIKLSQWGDEGAEGHRDRGGGQKRKRGPKKKKGDKNNVDEVMRLMESRKSG